MSNNNLEAEAFELGNHDESFFLEAISILDKLDSPLAEIAIIAIKKMLLESETNTYNRLKAEDDKQTELDAQHDVEVDEHNQKIMLEDLKNRFEPVSILIDSLTHEEAGRLLSFLSWKYNLVNLTSGAVLNLVVGTNIAPEEMLGYCQQFIYHR